MRRARFIREQGRNLLALLALVAVASAVSFYILANQRLPLPWVERYTVRAEFVTAQAVTPGQGQQVTVAGVKVGEVSRVELRDGRAIVSLDIERDRLEQVGRSARLLLRPKTPLQDMSVDMDPGPEDDEPIGDAIIPVAQTRANVNLDEVLSGLDADTRSYFRLMLAGFGEGLGENGQNLRRFFEATAPTASQLRSLDRTFAGRRSDLRRLVNGTRRLTGALADQRDALQALITHGGRTSTAIAEERDAVAASLDQLPDRLAQADRVIETLRPLSAQLATTADDLVPVARQLGPTLRRLEPFVREDASPTVAELRRLVPAARPLAQSLRPALRELRATTPQLSQVMDVANYIGNELGHVPEAPYRSYLFWLAWFGHNANSMLGSRDANGGVWRAVPVVSCTNLIEIAGVPNLADVLNPIVEFCPKSP